MLDGKVCVVTGGGRGLGKATAIHLGELGETVVVNDLGTGPSGEDRSDEPATEVAETIEAAGGTAMAHFGDVSSVIQRHALISPATSGSRYSRLRSSLRFSSDGCGPDENSHI